MDTPDFEHITYRGVWNANDWRLAWETVTDNFDSTKHVAIWTVVRNLSEHGYHPNQTAQTLANLVKA